MTTIALDTNIATINSLDMERHLVAMHIGPELYGVDIACIHTVLTPQPITAVPNVPDYIRGVMNLRGKIIAVIDMRMRFGLPELTEDKIKASRIMIVESDGLTAGLIVDGVSEVLRLPAGSVEPPAGLLGSNDLRCLIGIGRVAGKARRRDEKPDAERLLLILDVPMMLGLASTDAPAEFAAAA